MGSTPRFVLDTNVIVSALLLPDSKPRDAFNRALDSGKIMISISVFVELEAVLSRGKFDKYLTGEWRKEFLAALVREVDFVDIAEVSPYAVIQKMINSWNSRWLDGRIV
jgi:uncharacterized protein